MRIRLNGEFNEEYLNNFIQTMNEIDIETNLDVYLTTEGGLVPYELSSLFSPVAFLTKSIICCLPS